MADFVLDFEKPVQELEKQLLVLESVTDKSPTQRAEIKALKAKRNRTLRRIFSNLTRWQRVQLARHPKRPYSLDYIRAFCADFVELHGDRHYADDPAVVCGLGSIDGQGVVLIGQQKGRNTKDNLYRNFGMMRPEGYRKARRVMRLAEKFRRPVIALIDTPGAYPGIGAEERGQAEAIARNLLEMSRLRVPIIAVVIGEGASGGALGIGICDRLLMLENTWFSVISPEGCAAILWHDAAKAAAAADAMRVTPQDLEEVGICDRIVAEPLGGAHRDFETMAQTLREVLLEELAGLDGVDPDAFLPRRIKRYEKMGVFSETK